MKRKNVVKNRINCCGMQLRSVSLTLVIFIIFSCSNNTNLEERDPNAYYASYKKVGNENVLVCDVDKINRKITFPISNLIENCEMVYLETKDESLISGVQQVAVSQNYIGIVSLNNPVKLFDRNGTFLCEVGNIGRGPNEYTNLNGIQIIEESNTIFLTPLFMGEKILCYDLKGKFKRSIPLLYKQTKCKVDVSNDTLTIFSMPFDETIPVAYQQTIDGKLIQKIPIRENLISEANFDNEVLTSYCTDHDFQIIAQDTLFHYNTKLNILEPKLVFNFSGENVSSALREIPSHFFGTVYLEKGEYEYEKLYVIIDKKSLKASFYNVYNDFFGGIDCNLFNSCRGMFVYSKSAIELIEEINQIKKENKIDNRNREKMESILNNLHENDNDILFIGKLKNS